MNRPSAIILLVSLLALSSAGCRGGTPAPAAAPEQAVAVRTARVGGGGEDWIEVPGTVESARAASIASRFSALIEAVNVEEGAFVRAGDLLVRLDGRDLRARAEAAEAAFRAARSQRDRIRALFQKEAATQQELDAAEAADIAASSESAAAGSQLEYVDLRAPFDGLVTGKKVHAGDLALPGQTLVTLQGVGRLRVSASVPRGQAERLKPGQSVEAILEGGAVVACRVAVLGPAGDPESRRFLVKTDLPKESKARAGSFARLRLPRGGEEPEPLVPAAALFQRGALTGVYVVEEGRARLRWISPGETIGDTVVVRAGVTPGEEVILKPPALRDGTAVRVEAAGGIVPGAPPEMPAGAVPASSPGSSR